MALRKTIKKSNELETLEQANEVLKQLGIAELKIEGIENDMNETILEAKEHAAELIKPLKDKKKRCERENNGSTTSQ